MRASTQLTHFTWVYTTLGMSSRNKCVDSACVIAYKWFAVFFCHFASTLFLYCGTVLILMAKLEQFILMDPHFNATFFSTTQRTRRTRMWWIIFGHTNSLYELVLGQNTCMTSKCWKWPNSFVTCKRSIYSFISSGHIPKLLLHQLRIRLINIYFVLWK